jgi:histone RNA hairpin-binding protein
VEELDFECSSDEEDWGDGSTERGKTPEAEEEEEETDPKRLMQRQKQIDFGKNTKGYERYVQAVPK